MRLSRSLPFLFGALLIVACGQKGPLYLPDSPPPTQPAPAPASAPPAAGPQGGAEAAMR